VDNPVASQGGERIAGLSSSEDGIAPVVGEGGSINEDDGMATSCAECKPSLPLLRGIQRSAPPNALDLTVCHELRGFEPNSCAAHKNGRSFDLPTLQLDNEILAPLRGPGRNWVFPSPGAPNGHVTSPERIASSPRAHRRKFATVAFKAGVLEELVGRLLNRTPPSITGQRHAKPSLEALRSPMECICAAFSVRIGSPAAPQSLAGP
jgi:hypothetical protein